MTCHRMLMSTLLVLGCFTSVSFANGVPGALKLLEGYQHVPLQGIDSRVGKIQHKDGFEIMYEIGRVSKPGTPRFGGDFTDRAVWIMQNKQDDMEWSAAQVVNGQRVNLVLLKEGRLTASFPDTGANFSATIKSHSQLADTLTMLLTYPAAK